MSGPLASAQETAPQREFPQALPFRLFISMTAKSATGTAPVQAQSELEQVVALTNAERANAGCGPVTMNNTLAIVAQAHAVDMAENDFFDHNSLNGDSPFDRMQAAGYHFSAAGENIAAGYASPASVMAGWMNSDGHRANILNCSFTEIGVGYYKLANDTGDFNYVHYWVQDFGRP
jgi:uncharacterized protein YkwD